MADPEEWSRYFPEISSSTDEALARLKKAANLLDLPAGQTIFQPGGRCGNYLLVLAGTVRVQILTPSGREVLLYRVNPGHACILTTSCLLGANDYPAFGITETQVAALAIPAGDFHQAIGQSVFFRTFVFSGFADRLSRVIVRMEELLEGDIDRMLARALLDSARDGKVDMTHQELAIAIGSAREVVSRHLKRMESLGWVKLSRGSVDLIDQKSLLDLAGGCSSAESSVTSSTYI
jgi:CRP/FNR family transcriptional regulator